MFARIESQFDDQPATISLPCFARTNPGAGRCRAALLPCARSERQLERAPFHAKRHFRIASQPGKGARLVPSTPTRCVRGSAVGGARYSGGRP